MILIAKETDSSITKDKEYFCFGVNLLIDRNVIYVYVLRDNDDTPVLIELNKFHIKSSNNIDEWSKKFYLNGMRILLAPKSIIDFDWDLYNEGDEMMEIRFKSIYSNLYDAYTNR